MRSIEPIGKVARITGCDEKCDRSSEQDPLSARTAQPGRCSGKEQHQSEEHSEDGVVVRALVVPERISETAVGALVRRRGLGRSGTYSFILNGPVVGSTLSNPSSVGLLEVRVKRLSTYVASAVSPEHALVRTHPRCSGLPAGRR